VKGDVKVGSGVLSRYAGNYESRDTPMKATITVTGEQLMFSLGGRGAVPLTTLSETSFYFPGGFPVDFVKDDKGQVTQLVFQAPGSDLTLFRVDAANQ
jgi:hypothetical protein